jgi:hypothetical protein
VAIKKVIEEVEIQPITREKVTFCILGTSPFISNAMSEKSAQELMVPGGRKNAADKASRPKHDVIQEYRSSVYNSRDINSPTRVIMPSISFKASMGGAALDLPGVNKSQVSRLCYVEGQEIAIYGLPELMISIVRQAGMTRTPDTRTRAIFPRWAAFVTVVYTTPLIKLPSVMHLMAAAGITQGIGDWRVGKGTGNYGQFEMVSEDHSDFVEIVTTMGREEQDQALLDPVAYDSETEALLTWYDAEVRRRGFRVAGREMAA